MLDILSSSTTDGAAISQCVINYWQKQTLICDCILLTSIRDLYFSSQFNLRGVQVLFFPSKLFLFSFGLYSLNFDWMVQPLYWHLACLLMSTLFLSASILRVRMCADEILGIALDFICQWLGFYWLNQVKSPLLMAIDFTFSTCNKIYPLISVFPIKCYTWLESCGS